MNTYEYYEGQTSLASVTSQGQRISQRLQAALNYAICMELEMGFEIDELEVGDGIANGVFGMTCMLHKNWGERARPISEATITTIACLYREKLADFIDAMVPGSTSTRNTKAGHA